MAAGIAVAGLRRGRHLLPGAAAEHQSRSVGPGQDGAANHPGSYQYRSRFSQPTAGTGTAGQCADRPSCLSQHGTCNVSGHVCKPVVGEAQAAPRRSAHGGPAAACHAGWAAGGTCDLCSSMVARVLVVLEGISDRRVADPGYSRWRLEPLGRTAGGSTLGRLERTSACGFAARHAAPWDWGLSSS